MLKTTELSANVAIYEAATFDHTTPQITMVPHPTESHLRAVPNIIQDNELSAPKLALLLPTS